MIDYTTAAAVYHVDANGLALDILDFVTTENPTPFAFATRSEAEAFAAELTSKGYVDVTIKEG